MKTTRSRQRLYRSRTHRVIAGVCGGIADYFGISPNLVRALFVIAPLVLPVIGVPAAALLYIVMAVVVPEEPITEERLRDVA